MKNKVLSILKITVVLLTILSVNSACTKENWYENPDNTVILFEPFQISNTMWSWNDNMSRYEYRKSFPNLTKYIYDNGVVNASVFLKDGSVEVQTPLPYIRTWNENGGIYTEVLSFDISYDDNSILYYIQASDLIKTDTNNFPLYEIKVSVIYK